MIARPEKIAVFRALQLGDMLCAVPALRALRAAFAHAHITLVGLPWAEQFARRFHAYVDDFVAFPGHPEMPEQTPRPECLPDFYQAMRARRFDLAVQMHGSGVISNAVVREFGAMENAGFVPANERRPDTPYFLDYPEHGAEPLRLLQLAAHLGGPAQSAELEFPLAAQDRQELHDSGLARGLAQGHYICIHPGARFRRKCWPTHNFAQVADALAQDSGLPIVLTGAANESDLTGAVAACMKTTAIDTAAPISLGAMAALMSGARLLVCNDTGVSHLAAALKLPSVVIFSASDMERWAPLDHELHRRVKGEGGTGVEAALEQARSLLNDTRTHGAASGSAGTLCAPYR